ncbi:MAG: B12-binding domain-containing radical SAM protein, partial [Planctomycetota bacterium]
MKRLLEKLRGRRNHGSFRGKIGLVMATRDLENYNYYKPLGLAYLKSYADVRLPDLDVEIFDSFESLLRAAPDCVGISATTQDFNIARQYVDRVREEIGVPVLMGGPHVSLLPETLPRGAIGCIGEGEETFVELCGILKMQGGFPGEALSGVKGIAYYDEEGVFRKTDPRDLVTPIDDLPLPDRGALGIRKGKNDNLYMFSSRGCPYRCKFCVSRVHWKKYREFSAEYVNREIDELIGRYGVKHIHFFDDLFIVNKKRLRRIADHFHDERLNITTSCAVRGNLVNDEMCDLLKKLNVNEVMFGAESFSESVLDELKCGSVSARQNQEAIDVLHK